MTESWNTLENGWTSRVPSLTAPFAIYAFSMSSKVSRGTIILIAYTFIVDKRIPSLSALYQYRLWVGGCLWIYYLFITRKFADVSMTLIISSAECTTWVYTASFHSLFPIFIQFYHSVYRIKYLSLILAWKFLSFTHETKKNILHSVQTYSGAHPASYSRSAGGSSRWDSVSGAWIWCPIIVYMEIRPMHNISDMVGLWSNIFRIFSLIYF